MFISKLIRSISLLFAAQMTAVENEILNKVAAELSGSLKQIFETQKQSIVGVKRNMDGSEVYFLFRERLNDTKSKLPRFSFEKAELKIASLDLEYCKASFKVDVWVVKNVLFSIEYSRLPDVINECLDFCVRNVRINE